MSTSFTVIFYFLTPMVIFNLYLASRKTQVKDMNCNLMLYTFGKSLSKKFEPTYLDFSASFRSSFQVRCVILLLRFQSLLKCSIRNLQNSVQNLADIAMVDISSFFRGNEVLMSFLSSSKAFLSFIPRLPPILRFIKVF